MDVVADVVSVGAVVDVVSAVVVVDVISVVVGDMGDSLQLAMPVLQLLHSLTGSISCAKRKQSWLSVK